jgi:transcriptional regulator GlxA family with amidase domain
MTLSLRPAGRASTLRAMRGGWIAVFPDVQTLDVTGPLEVFSIANRLGAARTPRYAVCVVAAKRGGFVRVETIQRVFRRVLRVAPGQYRRHFRAS